VLLITGIAVVLLGVAIIVIAMPRFLPSWRQGSITDWLLVILTLSYVVVTALQLSALHKNMQVAQRAWVTIASVSVEVKAGTPLRFSTVLENSGNSPAVLVKSVYGIALHDANRPLDLAPEPGWERPDLKNTIIIGPRQRIDLGTDSNPGPPITADTVEALKAKTSMLYRFGRIKYRDAFNVVRETKYCFVYEGTGSGCIACSAGNEFN
jgi:hypothetical protein